ncbi:MAG: hypothetical protein KJO36_03675 [Acidimicrobiia bacterium]|nr:hypothetical protein [Acidimicrobiia bacterium]
MTVGLGRTDDGGTGNVNVTFSVNGELVTVGSKTIQVPLDDSEESVTVSVVNVVKEGVVYAPSLNRTSSITLKRPGGEEEEED